MSGELIDMAARAGVKFLQAQTNGLAHVKVDDILDARRIALMKPTACLANTARGELIVESDLVTALKTNQIANAGIDVFETEPTESDNPLFKLDNVILSPHIAGVDTKSVSEMRIDAAINIVNLYKGEWPEASVINNDLRNQWNW